MFLEAETVGGAGAVEAFPRPIYRRRPRQGGQRESSAPGYLLQRVLAKGLAEKRLTLLTIQAWPRQTIPGIEASAWSLECVHRKSTRKLKESSEAAGRKVRPSKARLSSVSGKR